MFVVFLEEPADGEPYVAPHIVGVITRAVGVFLIFFIKEVVGVAVEVLQCGVAVDEDGGDLADLDGRLLSFLLLHPIEKGCASPRSTARREVNSSQSRPCEPRCRSQNLRERFPVRHVPSG